MNYIDLRNLEGEELKAWKKAVEEQTGYDFKELSENSPSMIPESEWDNYAWDMANDYFGINLDEGSLSCYFDNEKWARDLKMDYSEIEVDGMIYYFNSY